MTRLDRAIARLLVALTALVGASITTDLPCPWGGLAWVATVACGAWVFLALLSVERLLPTRR